jgi:hypothetical protein
MHDPTDTVFVPFYNDIAIYGDQRIMREHLPFSSSEYLYPFLSETQGSCNIRPTRIFCDPRYSGLLCYEEMITRIDKIQKVNLDSMLITTGHYFHFSGWTNTLYANQRIHIEYTKNRGLTFACMVDTVTHDTIQKFKLINYHINH